MTKNTVPPCANHCFVSEGASVVEHQWVTPIWGYLPEGGCFHPVDIHEDIMCSEEGLIKETVLFPIIKGPAREAKHRFALTVPSVEVLSNPQGAPP